MALVSTYTGTGDVSLANTPTPPVTGVPNAPTWTASVVPTAGVWAQFSLNTMSAVDPAASITTNPNYPGIAPWATSAGQRNVLNLWNGGVFADAETYSTHGAWMIYGGGHGGYQGSELYALDMGTRRFVRLSDPYSGDCSVIRSDGWYPNNSPIPTHTYDALGWHPPSKSFVFLRGNTVSSTGTSSNSSDLPIASMFSTVTSTWRKSTTDANMAHHSGMKSAYDSENDCFWLMGANVTKIVKFSSVSGNGTWTGYNFTVTGTSNANAAAIDGAMCYDPEDDLLLCSAFKNATKTVFGFRIVNGALVTPGFTLTTTGTGPALETAHGWEWSQNRRSILYYRRNGEVWELKKPVANWQTTAWAWNLLTSGINTLIPPNKAPEDNGVYGCFNLARYADMEIAVLVTRVDQPAYAFRIP